MGDKARLNGRTVKGGTGWAIQMGIDKGIKDIFTFDPKQKNGLCGIIVRIGFLRY